jgi:hypothetical protein
LSAFARCASAGQPSLVKVNSLAGLPTNPKSLAIQARWLARPKFASRWRRAARWLAQPKLARDSDERRLASPMPASWNQIAGWLKQIDSLRQAA